MCCHWGRVAEPEQPSLLVGIFAGIVVTPSHAQDNIPRGCFWQTDESESEKRENKSTKRDFI